MRILPFSLVLALAGCKDNGSDSSGRTSNGIPEFEDVNGTGVSVAAYDMDKVIEDENGVKLLSNRLDVQVKEGTTDAQAQEIAASIGGTLIAKNEPLRYYSVEIPETDVEGIRSALEQLAREDAVTFAEPVFLNGEAATDNEDYANQDTLWAFTAVQLYKAHNLTANYNSTDIVVAVIDSGLTTYHADNPDESEISLDSRSQYWYNFVSGESDATEKRGEEDEGYGHGTAVAGVISAKNNGNGINGVAYTSSILPLNVFDEFTGAPPSSIADAIAYAATPPISARVINLSLTVDFEGIGAWYNFFDGREDAYSKLEAAVRYSNTQGTIIIAAAGNEAKDSSYQLPAASDYVISVGATNEDDQRWEDSNYSADNNIDHLGIAAPGSFVPTASIKNEDSTISAFSGTSASAPMVSGLAALVLSVTDEDYTTEEILNLLREHADLITITYPDGSEHTWYRINACKTVAAVLGEDESTCEESTTTDPNDTDDDGDGYTENEGDCDDADATRYTGASEDCSDGADNDCDYVVDTDDSDCEECMNYSTTITTTEDAFLRQEAPSTNYDESYLNIGASSCCVGRSIIYFDSSEFEGAEITSATLTFYAMSGTCRSSYSSSDCGYDLVVEGHEVQDSWSASTVTWNTTPSYNSTAVDSTTVNEERGASDVPYPLTVTSMVQDWADGSNYGVLLKADSSGETTGGSQKDVTIGAANPSGGSPDSPAELYVEYCK